MIKRQHPTAGLSAPPKTGDHGVRQRTLMKPMSFAYWRKHWRHILRPYFRIRPCRFEQTRLQKETAFSLVTESKVSALGVGGGAAFALQVTTDSSEACKWRQPPLRFRLPPRAARGLLYILFQAASRPKATLPYSHILFLTKSENPGRIFLDGSSRAAGDPCCFLGCNEVKGTTKRTHALFKILGQFTQKAALTNGACAMCLRSRRGGERLGNILGGHS